MKTNLYEVYRYDERNNYIFVRAISRKIAIKKAFKHWFDSRCYKQKDLRGKISK